VPDIPAYSQKQNFENAYTRYLPSLNLRMKVNDELQFRAAFARAMARPDFYLLQAFTSLGMTVHTDTPAGGGDPVLKSIDYTGTLRGNTFLKPVMSTNMDLTAEYYFGKASSATLGVFNKRLKDIIISQTAVYPLPDVNGKIYNFLATGPTNGMDAKVSGLEASFQMYFDKLPGVFSGLGVSTNATLLHSTTSYHDPVNSQWCTPKGTLFAQTVRNLQGCDTDGSVFGNMPMTGLSKKSANVALLYDKGELSMRLAYSWRDKYLQSTNAYGTAGGEGIDRNPASPNQGNSYSVDYGLPTWGGAYGQLDFGLQYKIGEHIRVGGQIGNLTNQIYKQYMQQHIGMKLRSEFYTGRSYGAQLNYTF